jgi:adenosylcobinamide kinase/adenosylcobinamide-phosphate guanylyltransferase
VKKVTLVLGGIRSGKSFFVEQKALKISEKPVYIATADNPAGDEEMVLRIAVHRKRRGERFENFEALYDLTGTLSKLKDRTVVVDCLTLHLSNRLMATEEYMDLEELIESDEEYLEDIYGIIRENNLKVIFVSNEVGMAPVEMNRLGRFFQDLQGRWNRKVAEFADEVYFIQAGIPRLSKKQACYPFKLSAPSYVLPTGYIENVTYLMDKVDDVQLLAFDSMPDDPLFKKGTVSTLSYLAKDAGLSYSVHMPVKPKIFGNFEQKLASTLSIIGQLSTLNISTFTFHYDLPDGKEWNSLGAAEGEEIDREYIRYFNSIKETFPAVDLSLENTETPLSALDRVVDECGISYAIDIGHLHTQDWDVAEVESRLSKASVVHLHGLEEIDGQRKDHRAITFDRKIFELLESYTGLLTIENYHKRLLETSLEILSEYY